MKTFLEWMEARIPWDELQNQIVKINQENPTFSAKQISDYLFAKGFTVQSGTVRIVMNRLGLKPIKPVKAVVEPKSQYYTQYKPPSLEELIKKYIVEPPEAWLDLRNPLTVNHHATDLAKYIRKHNPDAVRVSGIGDNLKKLADFVRNVRDNDPVVKGWLTPTSNTPKPVPSFSSFMKQKQEEIPEPIKRPPTTALPFGQTKMKRFRQTGPLGVPGTPI